MQAEGCRIADITVIACHPTPESQDRAFPGTPVIAGIGKAKPSTATRMQWMGIGEAAIAQRHDRN
jgi:hypothetical protein